jgi:hypothetical protein
MRSTGRNSCGLCCSASKRTICLAATIVADTNFEIFILSNKEGSIEAKRKIQFPQFFGSERYENYPCIKPRKLIAVNVRM